MQKIQLLLLPIAIGSAACGFFVNGPPAMPADVEVEIHLSPEEMAVLDEHTAAIQRVCEVVSDPEIGQRAAARGLSIVDVAWEDTGRAQGSSLGPNISDLTLQVRRRDRFGEYVEALMPVLRYPNFTDRTGDVPADRFFLRVGNERGAPLRTVPLLEVLRDLRRFVSAPESVTGEEAGGAGGAGGAPLDLSAPRDTHFLVSAQSVLLPIPRRGKAEFNPVLFNYQSAPGSPAVLVLLATREGTSARVIENRKEDATIAGWGQELYYNDAGERASFTAERRSDVAARIDAQGGPRSAADRSALGRGADVMAIVQVPLLHRHRGLLGGLQGGDGYAYDFFDDPLAGGFGPNDATIRVRPGPVRTDMERAVLGHGPRLGPFLEGYGGRLVRDARFPIRITVQFYKATSNGVISDADLDGMAKSIQSTYEHADFVGSLVVPPGDPARPTAWQAVPAQWFPW